MSNIEIQIKLSPGDGLTLELLGSGDIDLQDYLQGWLEDVGSVEFAEYYEGDERILGVFPIKPHFVDEYEMTWEIVHD